MRWRDAAGRLDEEITILAVADTVDPNYGSLTETPSTLVVTYAKVVDMRGRETFEAGQQTGEQFTRFQIRHRTDVTAKHKILRARDGLTYDIQRIGQLGRNDYLQIDAVAKQP